MDLSLSSREIGIALEGNILVAYANSLNDGCESFNRSILKAILL